VGNAAAGRPEGSQGHLCRSSSTSLTSSPGIPGARAVNLTTEWPRLRLQDRRGSHAGAQGPRGPLRARLRHLAQRSRTTARPITSSVVTSPPPSPRPPSSNSIENGIKLIVIGTERIPRRDVAQMVSWPAYEVPGSSAPTLLVIIRPPGISKMGGIAGPPGTLPKPTIPARSA